MSQLILLLYYLTLATLAAYGLHRAVLLVVHARHARRPLHVPDAPAPRRLPKVTVQLPLYNELHVATRLLDAVCGLDYPRQLLEIQILDDSDDETTGVLREAVAGWRRRGKNVQLLHRSERIGYKAGALQGGLEAAKGELIAVFDADFVPPPDFLRRVVPWFQDPVVGMVQTRWEHLNRHQSLLTRLQAILLDGHFVIEHTARHRSGRLFNFNGTAGVWRRRTILDSGGWQHDTLTEDLDLSYRAQLRGWRFVYLPYLAVPSELPADIASFKTQQFRWAKGSVQTARKLLGAVLRSAEPWWRKLEATIHLTNNSSYVLMVVLSLLIFPAMLARRHGEQWRLVAIDLPLFAAATVSIVAYYAASQRLTPSGESRPLLFMPALLALGIGLSVNNSRAVLSGLAGWGGPFLRTPKYRIDGTGQASSACRRKYRAALSRAFYFEGLLAAYFLFCTVAALQLRMWIAVPFLYLFLQGYALVFLLSLRSRRPVPRYLTGVSGAAPGG